MCGTVPVYGDEDVWRDHVEEHHVASAAEEVTCTRDQSMLATICRNFRKGGIREHVLGMMVTVILRLVVRPQENLDAMPRGLDGVCVDPRTTGYG